ncbi:FliM/FliN family flagellar motor switch protein [Myxococcota bacterium]|nr:FliM/FliN family flagellar motor switch protein [Myxococcota bacterium]
MSQILSQEEIEALQSAIDEGQVDLPGGAARGGNPYARYRFDQGSAEDGEVRNALEVIFTGATTEAEGWMVHLLERDLRLVLDVLEPMAFAQFAEEFRVNERPLAFVAFVAPLVAGDGLLALEPGLLYPVVEGIMGGATARGQVAPTSAVMDRAPSSIDLRIAGRLARRYLGGLARSWSEREPQRFEMRKCEADPRACRAISERTTVVVARYRAITPAADLGEMAVVVPEWLTRGVKAVRSARERVAVPAMEARLREMPVSLVAEMSPRPLKVRDLLGIRVGDVLSLDDTPRVRVTVEGVPRWDAVLGASGGRRAVQLQGVVTGGAHE